MVTKVELKKLIEGEVWDDRGKLDEYSTDASLFVVVPELVVAPRTVTDVQKLVRLVAARKASEPTLSLTARAAGTCMSGGSLNQSIIIDYTKHLNTISEVKAEEQTIAVEPGAYYRDMEKKTLAHNLVMPAYTASKDLCAVGGMVANNAGGEKSLTYGSTERYVRSLQVVLADGEEVTLKPLNKMELADKKKLPTLEGKIYRELHELIEHNFEAIQRAKPQVSKNSAGYLLWNVWDPSPTGAADGGTFDLTRLFTGSQGTLGLITGITFGLVPLKKYQRLLAITQTNFDHLPEVIATVLKFKPETFECYDDQTFHLAEQYLANEAAQVISRANTALTLMAEFAGDDKQQVIDQARRAGSALDDLAEYQLVDSPLATQSYWQIRRASFRLLREHVGGEHRTAPFIDDIIVRPETLSAFLPRLRAILNHYQLTYTLAGHIGNGNFHLIPLINLTDRVGSAATITNLAEQVFNLVFEFNGSMAGEHNDGIIRTPFLPRMYGEKIYDIFRQVKKIFDPQNIFNPGKKVGGTLPYALSKLSQVNTTTHL